MIATTLFSAGVFGDQTKCNEVYPITQDLQVFEDVSGRMSLEQVQKQPLRDFNKNSMGFSKSAFWVKARIEVPPNCTLDKEWSLQILPTYNDFVDVYLIDSKQVVSHFLLGDRRENLNQTRLPTLSLKTMTGFGINKPLTAWIKVSGQNTLAVKISLISEKADQSREKAALTAFSFILALLFFLVIFSFTNFVMFKQIEFLYFMLLNIGIFILGMLVYGFSNVFFPPGLGDQLATISQALNPFMLFLLVQNVLKLKTHLPRFFLGLLTVNTFLFSWTVFTVFIDNLHWSLPFIHPFLAFSLFSFFTISIWLWTKETYAKALFAITFTLFLSFGIQALGLNGLINKSFFTDHAVSLVLLTTLFLLFALFNYRQLKAHEQHLLLETIANESQQEVKQKRLFINLLSHEIRTPLSIVSASNQNILQEAHLLPDFLQKSLKNQKKALLKIRNILDMCLTQERMRHFHKISSHPIREVWQRIMDKANNMHQGENQSLQFRLESDLPEQLESGMDVYLSDLLTAFEIVLNNAFKYSPNNSTITVHLTVKKDQFNLSVQDQGSGFSKEMMTPSPFTRGKNTQNTSGLGLGLIIAQEIMNNTNGSLNIANLTIDGKTTGANVNLTLHKPKYKRVQ